MSSTHTLQPAGNIMDSLDAFGLDIATLEIGGVFLIVSIFFFFLFRTKSTPVEAKTEDETEVDLIEGQQAIDFLERLIKEKYNYYLYLKLLPIYLDHKIPEKNIVEEVKSKIYVSVVGSLTRGVKNEILKFFTEKGIEIFVYEKIVILMNETDFQASDRFTEGFREINVGNVDKMI